jgi:hypothetical protein
MQGLFTRISKIWTYGWLLAEALVVITLAQLVILGVPFRFYGRWLQVLNGKAEPPQLLSRRLRRVINIACRVLPWNPVCLPRAMAAKAMLARRGYASVLTLGVGNVTNLKNGAATPMTAHAWVTASDIIVSGRDGIEGHHALVHFGN